MTYTAKVVYTLKNGAMVQTDYPTSPESRNFVICCIHGDWSGFRSLNDCIAQFPELERKNREDGYYWVEER